MKTIYKYEVLHLSNSLFLAEVRMPKGAKVISAGAQGFDIVLWAYVDTEEAAETVKFHVIPTGVELNFGLFKGDFIGTVQLDDGLVFHIFEA